MAKDFNGTTSRIEGTIAAYPAGDYTLGAWVLPDTTGEANNGGVLFLHAATSTRMTWRCATSQDFLVAQTHVTTTALSQTSGTPLVLGEWQVLFATYRASDLTLRLFRGDLDSAPAELSYTSQTAGVGAVTTGTGLVVGNNAIQTITWDGRIEDPFIVPWEMTLAEMERFRQGDRAVLYERGAPTFHGLLETTAVDLSPSRIALTETSVSTVEGSPVARSWGHE